MDVVTLLISNPKSPLLEEPGKYTFDDGTMLPQATAMRCVSFRDHGYYFPSSERLSNFSLGIISIFSIQFHRSSSPSAIGSLNGRNGIHQSNGLLGIVDIGSGVNHRKRDTFTVADDMPFRAIFPAICGIRASFRPPKRARTELLSTTALDQSIVFAIPTRRGVSSRFFAKYLQPANPEACASTSCHYRILVLGVKVPKQFLSEPQTESPSMPDDPEPVADHLSGGASRVAKAVVLFPKVRLSAVAWASSILPDRRHNILRSCTVRSVLLESLSCYAHLRINNGMLIGEHSDGTGELFEREDSYYLYLKDPSKSDSAVRLANGWKSGATVPPWLAMPSH